MTDASPSQYDVVANMPLGGDVADGGVAPCAGRNPASIWACSCEWAQDSALVGLARRRHLWLPSPTLPCWALFLASGHADFG